MVRLWLLIFAAFNLSQAVRYHRTVSYEGELVAQCVGLDKEKFQLLLDEPSVDVWKVDAESRLDIRMSWELYERLGWEECSVLHESVEQLVVNFEKQLLNQTSAEWFEAYHRYDEIIDWYKDLAKNNPTIVKFVPSIGTSVEGRNQSVIHITDIWGIKDKVYFQCQIHAREWISGAVCMYIANYLVENFGKDERVTNLVKEMEFVFVPFVNPDGYEYTWTNSRLWRKNRRAGKVCDGVDLNRNYNSHWGEGGGSTNECSETYQGPNVESEPETQNIVKFFKSAEMRLVLGGIDWHSYSQLILRPYGWTTDDSPDEQQLKKLGEKMSEDIFSVEGKRYVSQKKIGLYKTTGTASDWFYSDDANESNNYRAAGFTIELRDTGHYGFELPPDQIIPNGREIVPAILRFAEELRSNPLKRWN